MKKYHIGICDDEMGTCAKLEEAVYGFFEESKYGVDVEVWYSGEDCLKSLVTDTDIDILFLDIEFPGMNGVDIGKCIREKLHNSHMQIVYISSKTGYAMELFQVHPYDFLIKPINNLDVSEILMKILNLDENDKREFRYKTRKEETGVPFGKIMYLNSRDKKIELHLEGGCVKEYFGKLSTEKEKLPIQFVTVSKSFIVNMKYIASFKGDSVRLINDEIIKITAPHRESFRAEFSGFLEGGTINA